MADRTVDHETLRELLYSTFRLSPNSIVADSESTVPGATLWTGARLWCKAFRSAGLRAGDRMLLALPSSRAHIVVTLACWWEGLTVCPVPPSADLDGVASALDVRLVVSDRPCAGSGVVAPTTAANPPEDQALELRSVRHHATTGVAAIFTTSGSSSGSGRQIALSHRNLLAQLRSHVTALGISRDDVTLSVLPWHHAFGALVDVWPALIAGSTVVACPEGARDAVALARTAVRNGATRLSCVPLQAVRIAHELPGFLENLTGGVVGGAAIDAESAAVLSGTRLRVGYGQTETSPGITLGAPGRFAPGCLGRPVGCATKVEAGTLRVRGNNVCDGIWGAGGYEPLQAGRWHDTGDLVSPDGEGGYIFRGRRDNRFKLANGRMIDPHEIEELIRQATGNESVIVRSGPNSIGAVIVGAVQVSVERLRDLLGPCARPLTRLIVIADTDMPRTRKGEPDRGSLSGLFSAGEALERAA